jgi:hypothetical protein
MKGNSNPIRKQTLEPMLDEVLEIAQTGGSSLVTPALS